MELVYLTVSKTVVCGFDARHPHVKTPDAGSVKVRVVRAHILRLKREHNMGVVTLSRLTGISVNGLCHIRNGSVKWVRATNAEKILSIDGDYYVPVDEAREHLQWLRSKGVGSKRIELVTGIPYQTVENIRDGKTHCTYHRNVEKILGVGLHMFEPYRCKGKWGSGNGVVPDYLFVEQAS